MTDQLDRIEKTVLQILEAVKEERSPINNKWLTEPQVMKILNLTKKRYEGSKEEEHHTNQFIYRTQFSLL